MKLLMVGVGKKAASNKMHFFTSSLGSLDPISRIFWVPKIFSLMCIYLGVYSV